jgi:TolB protein
MRRHLVPLIITVILSLSAFGFAEEHWQPYTDKDYRVSLHYPSEWKKAAGYDGPRFESQDGFFMLDAAGGGTPQQVCQGSAEHHLHPYGSHPVVQSVKIQGRKACLVWPSEDQGAPWDAELVVEYPTPVKLSGNLYNLFVLYADKRHILQIMPTLRFTTQ